MQVLIALRHRTVYRYDRPILLGPQTIRLRPSPHARTPIPSYLLTIRPEGHWAKVNVGGWGSGSGWVLGFGNGFAVSKTDALDQLIKALGAIQTPPVPFGRLRELEDHGKRRFP